MEDQKDYLRLLKINERIIKITKSANIDRDLKIGHEYDLGVKVHCQDERLSDNHDGKYNKIYSLQLMGEIEIKNDLGEKTIAKVKGSSSQKLRWMLEKMGEDYDSSIAKVLNYPEEFISFLNRL